MKLFLAVSATCLTFSLALSATARADDAAVARGRYLAILGDCAGCHTLPHKPGLAGGLPFNTPFGAIYSTNITPDRDTGIGNWSEADFSRALHDGVAPGGKHLYPALPYAYFTRITPQDTADLFAYLKTLTPVHRPATQNKLMFPFNLRFGMIFWNWLYLDKTPPVLPANRTAQWKRGEYLVGSLGHCAACHTPKDILFGDVKIRPLGGGLVDHWFANTLTNNKTEGLGRWNAADVEKFLATGISRHASAAGSMAEKISSSTSRMTQEDRAAIAAYLKSLPAPAPLAFETPRREQMERGRGVFAAQCERCHTVPGTPHQGQGALAGYPNLPGDSLVMGHDATTVLRVILEGAAPPPATQGKLKPMPAFAKLDDGEIADVASYIRNEWGNSAPPVSATDVHALRRALAQDKAAAR
jgi:mono/diheme cytochrome c family protein